VNAGPGALQTPGVRRPLIGAVLLAAAALGVLAVTPVLFGAPDRIIRITWRNLAPEQRAALEQRFSLSEGAADSLGRWSYVPRDLRRETIATLVRDAAVLRVENVDLTFAVTSNALTARRGGMFPGIAAIGGRAAKALVYLLGLCSVALLLRGGGAATGITLGQVTRGAASQSAGALRTSGALASRGAASLRERRLPARMAAALVAAVERGVPVASAHAAGAFRIVFLALVLAYVVALPARDVSLEGVDEVARGWGHDRVISELATHPHAAALIDPALMVFGALALIGLATPVTYGAFAVAMLLWASVNAAHIGHHPFSALATAVIVLVPARWHHGWSADAWLARRRGGFAASGPARQYGFAFWATSLVLGVTFAAAAWSKLREGPGWILNGTVQYHFVTDLDHALVTWGPWLTRSHAVSVLLSAAAVATEAVVVTAAFSWSASYRAAMGLLAAALLSGFALFQGVIWPGWWILLIGFAPWQLLGPAGDRSGARHAAPGSLRPLQWAVVGLLIVQQAAASVARIEAKPLMSSYDMYSTTYRNRQQYEQASNLVYRVVGVGGAGSVALDDCVVDEATARRFAAAANGDSAARRSVTREIADCVRGRPDIQAIGLMGDRRVFDWDARHFVWKRGIDVIGPVTADWLRH
jgi:hypothetical protein